MEISRVFSLIDNNLITIILKIIGVGFLCEIASNIAKDCGRNTIADVITMGGKILILVISVPIIEALLKVVMGVLG
ncbi:MAG: stage III sporulation AC/AD family protein [Christensenellaceae bacterium]|jgi:stage III sporulation protein AD|nr:stage III sporulation AC/AD family protein [Christensenellaceae bacterium]